MAHILLIDDDADLVQTNKLTLESVGHRVSTAYSAEEGWQAAQSLKPELVVLDVMMEHVTAGFELAKKLREAFPHLPMVMLTSVDEHLDKATRAEQDHDEAWMPVQRYMEKPVAPSVLVYEIDALLHGH